MPIAIEDRHRNLSCPACGSKSVIARGSVFIRIGVDFEEVAKGYDYELDDTGLFACEDCKHDWNVA